MRIQSRFEGYDVIGIREAKELFYDGIEIVLASNISDLENLKDVKHETISYTDLNFSELYNTFERKYIPFNEYIIIYVLSEALIIAYV